VIKFWKVKGRHWGGIRSTEGSSTFLCLFCLIVYFVTNAFVVLDLVFRY